jgi:tetratricopeptide (TPR) repeat protein
LDVALQRMGEAAVDEILVISRAGAARIGVLSNQDAMRAYQQPDISREPKEPAIAKAQNWLPAVAAITVAAVLIVSGLVFWQRSRRSDLGLEAYRNGEKLLAQGQIDEAVSAFRNALAHSPQDLKARATLGLTLVQTGNFADASSYLSGVVQSDPQNGPAWAGLAEVSLAEGGKKQAMQLFRQSLSKTWPPQAEPQRRSTQFKYAALLSQAGQRGEAVPLLLSMIEQHGDDPVVGKQAADMVKAIGTPAQVEEAYAALSNQFPADAHVWLRLGDARFLAEQDVPALEAYQRAQKADPQNADARLGVARLQEILALDPTRLGLTVRQRASRWDEILQRILTAAAVCGSSPEIEKATPLLKKRAISLEVSDQKMAAALGIGKGTAAPCKTDAVLAHILSKVRE